MSKRDENHFNGTIFSSPERGVGGKSSYRGNCCPGIIESFINQFQMKYLSDYAIGGGTTRDVCLRLGVKGVWTDLRLGFDLMNDEISDCPENIFYHPPYFNMNGQIIYSNSEYDWKQVKEKYSYDPRISDLSQLSDWENFVKALNFTVMKQFSALQKGGRMGILMGDIKTKGKLNSMLLEIAKPGTVEQIIIKTQHNCVSDRYVYNGSFIPILHEYFLILKKEDPYALGFMVAKKVNLDARDSKDATWKDVVSSVLQHFNGKASMQQIYGEICDHKKCKTNVHWKAKVRQTLGRYSMFQKLENGQWMLVA